MSCRVCATSRDDSGSRTCCTCLTIVRAVKNYYEWKNCFDDVVLYNNGEQVFEEEFEELIYTEIIEEL